MRPETKVLEYHSKLPAKVVHFAPTNQPKPHSNVVPGDPDLASTWLFEKIEAAQKRTFSRTTTAEDGDDVAALSGKGQPLDDLEVAKTLFQIDDAKRCRHHLRSSWFDCAVGKFGVH